MVGGIWTDTLRFESHARAFHELLGKDATGSHRPQDPHVHIGAVHSRGGGYACPGLSAESRGQ